MRRQVYTHTGGLRMNTAGEKRTTLNISIMPDDKKFLKIYALKHDMTAAAVIKSFIQKLREDEDEKNG